VGNTPILLDKIKTGSAGTQKTVNTGRNMQQDRQMWRNMAWRLQNGYFSVAVGPARRLAYRYYNAAQENFSALQ
jgi:hypothetical protein